MTFDIIFCFLSGMVSFVTPQALFLLPVLFAAAGTRGNAAAIQIVTGLGLSLVLMGALAVSMGAALGFEAIWLRRIMCALLIMQGIILLSSTLTDRYLLLTGGNGAFGEIHAGRGFRQILLAVFVGANWVPQLSPSLGKASLMAADSISARQVLIMLFVFGAGAAVPWVVAGRVFGFVARPFMAGVLYGPAGKRFLGLLLLAGGIAGLSGLDAPMLHWLETMSPDWARKLAMTF